MNFFRILLIFCTAAAVTHYGSACIPAWQDVQPGVIVIDAGHGGVDGGANRDGILEKNINLSLALKLRALLEEKGYLVVMTREKDIALDHLNKSSSSRHRRDLIARADIINKSAGQLFISIHVNSLPDKPSENGSIVYFGKRFKQSKALADYIQKELNSVKIDGIIRMPHTPLINRYYILGCTAVPGVLVETAFMTNAREREMLQSEVFQKDLVAAVAEGTDMFLKSETPVYSGALTPWSAAAYNMYGFSMKEEYGWNSEIIKSQSGKSLQIQRPKNC